MSVPILDERDKHLLEDHKYHLNGRRWVRSWYNPEIKKPRKKAIEEDILGSKEGFVIFHVNGDPNDCRRSNLSFRPRDGKIQTYGLSDEGHKKLYHRASKADGYRGITFKKGKYHAQITIKRKNHFLGVFDTEVEAAEAYDLAVVQHLDLKDILNFPEKYLDYKAKLGKLSEQEAQQKLDSFNPEYTEVGESYLHLIDSL